MYMCMKCRVRHRAISILGSCAGQLLRGMKEEDRTVCSWERIKARKMPLCVSVLLHIHRQKKKVEDPGINPGTSRMLSEYSTI